MSKAVSGGAVLSEVPSRVSRVHKYKYIYANKNAKQYKYTNTYKQKYKSCVATASKAVSGGAVVIRSHEQGFTKRAKKRGTEWITCFETTI